MINNALTLAISEAKEIDFEPMAEGMSFVYETERDFNAIKDALTERAIMSLQETGSIQPLNEQEKDGFFVKVGDVFKKFWKWVCSVWDKFTSWVKGLFTRGDKEKDKAAAIGAKEAGEEAGPSSYEYTGVFTVSNATSKARDFIANPESAMSDNIYDEMTKIAESMCNNHTSIDNCENVVDIKKKYEIYQRGKEINGIYKHYKEMFVSGGGLTSASTPVNQATADLRKQKDEFDKFVNEAIKKAHRNSTDNIDNSSKYIRYNTGYSAQYKNTAAKNINLVQCLNLIQHYFTLAYSVQMDGKKKLLLDLKKCKEHFAAIGIKKMKKNGSPDMPGKRDWKKPEKKEEGTEGSQNESYNFSNEFLSNLSII